MIENSITYVARAGFGTFGASSYGQSYDGYGFPMDRVFVNFLRGVGVHVLRPIDSDAWCIG